MCQKASGTFLWAALTVQELQDAGKWQVLKVVDETPPGLDAVYGRMLTKVEELKWGDSSLCLHILAAVTLTTQPMHLAELGAISGLEKQIADDVESVRSLVNRCGSFLTVKDGIVYLIHQSAKEYLGGTASRTVFPDGATRVHYDLFTRSLTILMSKALRRNVYGLSYPGQRVDDIRVHGPDPLLSLRYSCSHWIHHFCAGIKNARISDDQSWYPQILNFFQSQFLHWLEALSLLKMMPEAVKAIAEMMNALPVSQRTSRPWRKMLMARFPASSPP